MSILEYFIQVLHQKSLALVAPWLTNQRSAPHTLENVNIYLFYAVAGTGT
jgi:hypothetical protein